EPPGEDGELAEPEAAGDEAGSDANGEAAAADAKPEGAPQGAAPPGTAEAPTAGTAATAEAGAADAAQAGTPVPTWFWVLAGIGAAFLLAYYALLSFARLEIFRMLLSSFFPLAVLILAVLGAIVFGLATPSEAAAVGRPPPREAAAAGSFGGFLLAIACRQLNRDMMKESVFLTAKPTAMVCWLFVGSSIFSAAFALLGGQEIIEQWVLSLGLTKV